jgi:DNA-binding NarL/FixJ family response regulator
VVNEQLDTIIAKVPAAQASAITASMFCERLAPRPKIALIEPRALFLECVARSLRAHLDAEVEAFPNLESLDLSPGASNLAIIGGVETLRKAGPARVRTVASRPVPIILLADALDRSDILDSMRLGISGYIPTTTSLEVAIEAIRLVLAGGKFLPAESVLEELSDGGTLGRARDLAPRLTAREKTIVEALRKGSQNKQISYSLNLSESTVRVHIRNIMRKLNARNRTEVVVKLLDE